MLAQLTHLFSVAFPFPPGLNSSKIHLHSKHCCGGYQRILLLPLCMEEDLHAESHSCGPFLADRLASPKKNLPGSVSALVKSCDAFLIVNRKSVTRQTLQLFTAICGIPWGSRQREWNTETSAQASSPLLVATVQWFLQACPPV